MQEHAHLTITDKSPAGLTVTPEANAVAAAVPILGHQEGQVRTTLFFVCSAVIVPGCRVPRVVYVQNCVI